MTEIVRGEVFYSASENIAGGAYLNKNFEFDDSVDFVCLFSIYGAVDPSFLSISMIGYDDENRTNQIFVRSFNVGDSSAYNVNNARYFTVAMSNSSTSTAGMGFYAFGASSEFSK